MDYVRLGKTGLEVSRICFGCMSFGTNKVERPWVLGLDEARERPRPVLRAVAGPEVDVVGNQFGKCWLGGGHLGDLHRCSLVGDR